jgi:hypothetical protein
MRGLLLGAMLLGAGVCAGELSIGSFANGATDGWSLYLGKEFPGAHGSFAVEATPKTKSGYAAFMEGAFGLGGAYVSLDKKLKEPRAFRTLRFKVKTSNVEALMIRLRDSKGVHQHVEKLKTSDDWQEVVVKSFKGERYSAWGGAQRGVFAQPLTGVSILMESCYLKEGMKSGTLLLTDIVLEE